MPEIKLEVSDDAFAAITRHAQTEGIEVGAVIAVAVTQQITELLERQRREDEEHLLARVRKDPALLKAALAAIEK